MDQELVEGLKYICQGYSKSVIDNKPIFFKHFGLMDHVSITEKYSEAFERAKSKGVPEEKEQLSFCIENGVWQKQKEDEIERLNSSLKYNLQSLGNLTFGNQKKQVEKAISDIRAKLSELHEKRNAILGITAEAIASRRANEYFVYYSSFTDASLETLWFGTLRDFEEAEEYEISRVIHYFNKEQSKIETDIIKKISIHPFFTNIYRLCEDPSQLFGKPLLYLSFVQAELLNYSQMYKRILSEPNIPESIRNDPDKLVDWYNSKQKTTEVVDKTSGSGKTATSMVGATKEEMQSVGLTDGIDARAAIRKQGGVDKKGMMKLLGAI